MQVNGIIKSIGVTQQVTDNFSKREMVLEIDQTTQYPQTILFEAQNTKITLLDSYQEGEHVSVDFNLRGRQWTDKEGVIKTLNTLNLWKIERVNNGGV